MRRWGVLLMLSIAVWGLLWHDRPFDPLIPPVRAAETVQGGAETPDRPEPEEPDPYKIHREYKSEPWRLPESYRILTLHILLLLLLNGAVFAANRQRRPRP